MSTHINDSHVEMHSTPLMPNAPPPPTYDENYQDVFKGRMGLLIRQTMKGCCCNVLNEFSVHDYIGSYAEDMNAGPEIMFADESAGCFLRCMSHFAPGFRPTSFDIWTGAWSEEEAINRPDASHMLLRHEKGCTNGASCWILEGEGGPLRVPCCFALPYLNTIDGRTDQKLGTTQYICDQMLCVPKYEVLGPDGEDWYRIRPETCLGGCCVQCKCTGMKGKCCFVPFYVRSPMEPYDILEGDEPGSQAEIANLWSGLKECCRRNNYSVRFPRGASAEQKATLMGSTFLLEMLHFEQE